MKKALTICNLLFLSACIPHCPHIKFDFEVDEEEHHEYHDHYSTGHQENYGYRR